VTLVRGFEDDEYNPEYSTLVLRDAWPPPGGTAGWTAPDATGLPREYPTDSQPAGTIARAGRGWLEGSARDGFHVVRLELHDGPPADDGDEWHDIMETPYRSEIGAVGLTMVTGGTTDADLDLGGPGPYAVRVCHRRGSDSDGDVWCLRFWPRPPESPRWLARGEAATQPGRTGWDDVLGRPVMELSWVVGAAARESADPDAGATLDEVDAKGRAYQRRPGWLDAPLWPDPPAAMPTGHADLDAAHEERRAQSRAHYAKEAEALAPVAAQLGVPMPGTPRELLPLLVAAGIVAATGDRYRVVSPRPAQEVLDLPAERVAQLEAADEMQRYRSFATDLLSIVVWAPDSPTTVTVRGLAERLLASPAEVRAALRYTARVRLLTVDGAVDDPDAPVSLAVGPGREPVRTPVPPQPAPRPAANTAAPVISIAVSSTSDLTPAAVAALARARLLGGASRVGAPAAPPPPAPPPWGAPPKAGFVTGTGDLVVWRDGEPVVLRHGTERHPPYLALETGYGVLLLGSGPGAVLVRPDGRQDRLGTEVAIHGAVSGDGRYAAFSESHYGRHSWAKLHLVDLSDGSRETMPWNDESDQPSVVALHGGAVYAGTRRATVRWTPGAEPEPYPHYVYGVDPVSGTVVGSDTQGRIVVHPDGTVHRPRVDAHWLVPGGTRLLAFRYSPPAVTLFDVATAPDDPQVHWLPAACDVGSTRPCWEDAYHLLIPVRYPDRELRAPALRLDIRTGALERVPLTPEGAYRAQFVQPLIRGNDDD
jgi:hypothetical protein